VVEHEPAPRRRTCRSTLRSTTKASSGEWQDWLVDDTPSQGAGLWVESEELEIRAPGTGRGSRRAQQSRARRIFEARPPRRKPNHASKSLARNSASRARRVRQIEMRAFEKVRKAVQHRGRRRRRPASCRDALMRFIERSGSYPNADQRCCTGPKIGSEHRLELGAAKSNVDL